MEITGKRSEEVDKIKFSLDEDEKLTFSFITAKEDKMTHISKDAHKRETKKKPKVSLKEKRKLKKIKKQKS